MSRGAWTAKKAAASSYRSIKALLAAADKHLDNVALCWADEDSCLEHSAHDAYERIVSDLKDLEKEIRQTLEFKAEEARDAVGQPQQESLLP